MVSPIPLDGHQGGFYFAGSAAAPVRGRFVFIMNIHEYQAKELFDKFGVPTPQGQVADSVDAAKAAASSLSGQIVVKAQVHAGGRGKGTFKNGFKGGVHLVDSPDAAGDIAGKMIGEVLVTHQTGEEGKLVRKVLIAQSVDIEKEYYLAILMDRATGSPTIVASARSPNRLP